MSKIKIASIILVACGCLAFAGCGSTSATPVATETEIPTGGGSNKTVAILVIDDFGPPASATTATPAETEDLKRKNCILHWNGQQYSSRGASVGSTGAPHGVVVYAELSELIKTASGGPTGTPAATTAGPVSGAPWLRDVQLWHLSDGDVLLVAVDTEGYTTDRVSQNMQEAIAFFGDSTQTQQLSMPSASGFVLNMSFAVVPCEPDVPNLDEYTTTVDQDPALIALRDQLLAVTTSVDKQQASWLVAGNPAAVYPPDINTVKDTSWITKDPILDTLIGLKSNGTIIPVAAAGNTPGMSYPYAPALWPGVVSVSGCYEKCSSFDRETNAGEVMDDGKYQYSNEMLNGTSFAAPRISLLEAIYFLQTGTTTCPPPPTSMLSQPPLDYADYTMPVWSNLPVKDATNTYCPPFPTPIP